MAITQRGAAGEPRIKLPAYMPPDAIPVTAYAEVLEILRSPRMCPEQATENAPISGGVLTTTHGASHTRRRRIMNRLVRPAALEHYRDVLLLPALRAQLADLYANPDPDHVHRADL